MTTERIVIESRRKIVVGLIALLAALALFAATAQEANATKGGTCGKYGDNLTWELRDGVLTISGEGEMADYEFNPSSWSYNQPWWGEDFTKVVVNEGVTSLGNNAFQWHEQLEEAVLPESLKRIGDSAFEYCGTKDDEDDPERSLTVNLPSGLVHIGESAFAYSGIKQIAIPKGVKNLERTFDRSDIETVDLGEVENIGGYTFYFCYRLKQVNLPKTLKAIGSEAFAGTSLTEVIIPEGVEIIGQYFKDEPDMSAFNECRALERVVLPASLTFISENEFGGCDNLKELDFSGTEDRWKELISDIDPNSPLAEIMANPDIEKVYDGHELSGPCGKNGDNVSWALVGETLYISGEGEMADYEYDTVSRSYNRPWEKESFSLVVVGDGVTSVGKNTFYGCRTLVRADLPESLESIGDSAFEYCGVKDDFNNPDEPERSLTVNLPSGINYIGTSAFAFSGIKDITIPEGVTKLIRAFQGSAIETVNLGKVDEIGEYTFANCGNLKSVALPETLKEIGAKAFTGTSLTEVDIPEGVMTIGQKYVNQYGHKTMPAFTQCKELERAVLPSTLTFISEHEFMDCGKLKEICFRGSEARWKQLTTGINPNSSLGEIMANPDITIVYNYNGNDNFNDNDNGDIIKIRTNPDTPAVLANPMTVKGKTVKVKRKKLKKKAQTIKADRAITVNNAQGMVTYQKVSVGSKKVNKKYGKKIKINSSTGKITVKKGLKKGTYKVKVNVSAAGNANYYPLTRTTIVKIRVK